MSEAKSLIVDGAWTGADGCTYTYGKVPKRKCVTCRAEYDWDGNKYKTRCKPCYVKVVRVCTACKQNNLKADAPSYQNVCTDCWLAKKSRTHKTCPTCPPDRANHLRCPMGKDQCPECEVRCQAQQELNGTPEAAECVVEQSS
jgi:hypothetical protein